MLDELKVHVVVGESAHDHTIEPGSSRRGHRIAQPQVPVDELDDALAPLDSVEERRGVHQLPISVRTV